MSKNKTEVIVRCISCGQYLYEYTADDIVRIDKQYHAYMLMKADDCEFIVCEKCEAEEDINRKRREAEDGEEKTS